MFTTSLVLNILAIGSLVHGAPQALSLHESVLILPAGWTFHSKASGEDIVSLKIILAETTGDKVLDAAHAVSDPESPNYGRYLSADELAHLTDTSDASVAGEKVTQWLSNQGVEDQVIKDGSVHFSTHVSNANAMFGSNFEYYELDGQNPTLRTKQYSLPREIRHHIDFVFPTVHFLSGGKRRSSNNFIARQHIPTGPVNCSNSICPQNLTSKYNIDYYPKDTSSGSKIGITAFIDNFPNKTDVQNFLRQAGQKAQKKVPEYQVKSINNGRTKPTPKNSALIVEPNLDLDYSLAFTGPLPAFLYSTGGRPPTLSQPGNKAVPANQSDNEPYLEFFQALLAEDCPPQVISISYSDDEQSVPIKYARKVCDLMAKAATRGITIIGSSGDGGAAGTGYSDCIGPDGKHRYIPTFPSSCPWITSVGATAGYSGPASYSSGGFSNYFPVPSWQASATSSFIKTLNSTLKPYYNASGRGIPDLSLLGDNYLIQSGGFNQTQKGTSASTPVFAAMIALLNDLRLRARKPVLGHLNPLIYSERLGPAFNDVISEFGSSAGCADGDFTLPGWDAVKGWDASTGLGEPDFKALRKLLV